MAQNELTFTSCGGRWVTMKITKILLLAIAATSFVAADHHRGPGHKMMMEKMDANKDGQISKEEWTKHHEEMFTKLDANADGNITKEEFQAHHKQMKDKMGKKHDKNKKKKRAKKEEKEDKED
jgi:hypothetical protein